MEDRAEVNHKISTDVDPYRADYYGIVRDTERVMSASLLACPNPVLVMGRPYRPRGSRSVSSNFVNLKLRFGEDPVLADRR